MLFVVAVFIVCFVSVCGGLRFFGVSVVCVALALCCCGCWLLLLASSPSFRVVVGVVRVVCCLFVCVVDFAVVVSVLFVVVVIMFVVARVAVAVVRVGCGEGGKKSRSE